MKISMKAFNLIFQVLVALLMSLFLSFFMIIINVGINELFLIIWLKSFGLSLIVALPVSLIIVPLLRKGMLNFFEVETEER